MTPPKSTDELSKHIEQVVARYMAEGRRVALESLERAFTPTAKAGRQPSVQPRRTNVTPTSSGRRTPAEIAEIGERLCELVRARPGEGMVTLAAELGLGVRELHRPMSALRGAGRVRTVGQRHLMCYFPAVDAGKR